MGGRGELDAGCVGYEVAGKGVEEEMPGWEVCAYEEALTVVGKRQFCQWWYERLRGALILGWEISGEVECLEGGFVVIPYVVKKYRGCACGCDGYYTCRRVPCCEVGGGEVEFALGVLGSVVPDADCVVHGAG